MPRTDRTRTRLNVRVYKTTDDALARLEANGSTPTEIVRRAIALMDYVEASKDEGRHMQMAKADGTDPIRVTFLY